VAKPQQVLGIGAAICEDEGQQQVERARPAEPGAGGDSHHGRMAEPSQPQHASRVHGRAQLQKVPAGAGELRVSRVQRIDRGGAREKDELGLEVDRFAISSRDRFPAPRHLAYAEDLGPVPTQLGGYGRAEQIARLRLQALSRDNECAQRPERKEVDDRAPLSRDSLGVFDERAGNRDRGDLASRHLLAFRHRLTVHEGEDRHVPEGVDLIDQVGAHTHQASPPRDQPSLALDRRLDLEVVRREGRRQTPRGLILVQVAGLELDNVDLGRAADAAEMLGPEHRPLAKVRAEIVHEDAALHVFDGSRRSAQPVGSHNCNDRFDPVTAPRFYTTLSRQKEELHPLEDGVVRIYSCGPTVYRYVHIGNLRTFMLPDLLRRSLEYLGYRTEQVMNITDVGHLTDDTFDRGEDKMLVSARLEKKSPEEIAAYYTKAFMDDAALVNIRPANQFPRATQYIPQMIDLIDRLISKGHAYVVDGTVYYDIASFPAYGRLSRNSTDKLLAGTRGEVDPRKRHPGDFTLWKSAGEHRLQVWPSQWGLGFPGWHIECSAMSMSLFGERFDIHTGGADNVFPHHEAELAQSEGVTGHRVVNLWMHGGLLMLAGARMAKSAGNFFRVTELVEQGFDPLAFRYLVLQAKYRTKLNFGAEGLAGADRALKQLRERIAEWSGGDARSSEAPEVDAFESRFRAALADDLDLPAAMALVAEVVRSEVLPRDKARLLLGWDRVLGLDLDRAAPQSALPPGAADLLEAREKSRAARDFAASDRLRAELAAMGVDVMDTPEGQRWKAARMRGQ
jgi:cysteinyl-tRNA synthetase